MKLSNLQQVSDLIQELNNARRLLKEYHEIPSEAAPFLLQTDWRNPDTDAPAYNATKYFSVRLDPEKDTDGLIKQLSSAVLDILESRVQTLEFSLRELGVDPTL